ncbi:hypothetical protein [Salinicoccus halitifaciens]|uniref:DUF4129 domain-containing protein n=1 Tax=Salinicoccus halitifaciens TaxID=1073415 RepID=A0ABV2EBE0_9STAP|nr:hypothetical protein [Salinicoccus halitifaciens]MCD2138475.1 hypothetical protein [Salinicoccus halitifaciens]
MSRIKYHASFLHAFLVEMALLLSVYLFLNIHNLPGDRNHVLFFLAVVLSQYIAGHLIAARLPVKYIYLLVPITLAAALFSGDYFLSALLISTIPVWRLEQLHYSLDESVAPGTVIAGLLWLIIITMISTPETGAHIDTFNIIFIASLAGYVAGRILTLALDSGYGKRPFIRLTSFFILAFITLSIVLMQVYRFAVFTLSYAVIFLLNAMVFMLRPFFDFLEGVELDYPEDAFQEEEAELDGYQTPDEVTSEAGQVLGIPFGMIILTLVAAAVIFAVYSYFRKREARTREMHVQETPHTVDHKPVSAPASKKAPPGKARRMYFDFEKWAASKGYGRYTDETIEQWFKRLRLHEHTSISNLGHYQAMRYKDKELTHEELQFLKSCIKEFKDIIHKKVI